MRPDVLRESIREAERFIKIAKQVKIEKRNYANSKPYEQVAEYTKESAACKRASMDLTRILAQLRRCNYG